MTDISNQISYCVGSSVYLGQELKSVWGYLSSNQGTILCIDCFPK